LNRSRSASVLHQSRRRASKLHLDLLPLEVPVLIARAKRANTATRSILDRNTGTCKRGCTAATATTPQPQRQSATHAIRKISSEIPRMAPKGTKHQPQLGPAAACRPVRTLRRPPTRAAPPQRHGRRRTAVARAAAAAQERQRAPDDTLRWQLLREPYPSAPPPCAHVPTSQHAQLSTEPAGGSQLPSLPPAAWGAAAPSSLQMSGEMAVTAFPPQSQLMHNPVEPQYVLSINHGYNHEFIGV
jgi:hypothetical protein